MGMIKSVVIRTYQKTAENFCCRIVAFFFQTTVIDACAQIRERLSEIKSLGNHNLYGLFLTDDDPKKGVWLDPGRTLEHYLLRDNVSIILLFTIHITYYKV